MQHMDYCGCVECDMLDAQRRLWAAQDSLPENPRRSDFRKIEEIEAEVSRLARIVQRKG